MKKIGLITYENIADGKGRFLQAYALYSAIEQLGYLPEVIDYYPKRDSSKSRKLIRMLKNINKLRLYANEVLKVLEKKLIKKELKEKYELYKTFIKNNIRTTESIIGTDEIQNANLKYDAYVCGSDQIWNPKFLGKDPTYYLQFAPEYKRIAYAPSLGTNNISQEDLKFLCDMIRNIPRLSVRESSSAKMLSKEIKEDVFNAIDPTLLMTREWWNNFANKSIEKEPYVLTFFFDNSTYPRKIANEIATQLGCKIISIPDTIRDILTYKNKRIGIGPEEFVSLFKNATFICTQSFHGTVLSLLYNRPFYVFDRETKAYVSGVFSRINDLLGMVGLENRILKSGQQIPNDILKIDYLTVNKILEIKRKESMEYLRESLEQATGDEKKC